MRMLLPEGLGAGFIIKTVVLPIFSVVSISRFALSHVSTPSLPKKPEPKT
jgi:hypothetical protein